MTAILPQTTISPEKHNGKRKSISVRARFEVFKRDNFTCRYCNRKSPDVVLQVDHVIAISEGGDNHIDNLATACWACNAGKSNKPLLECESVSDAEEQAIAMLEKERQLNELYVIKKRVADWEDKQTDDIQEIWSETFDGDCYYQIPRHNIRAWLREFDIFTIRELIDACAQSAAHSGVPDHSRVRYMHGVVKNFRIKQSETPYVS